VLRECRAAGADRAVLVCDPVLAGSDTLVTARVLAAVLGRLGPFDLVLCGQHSTDSETGQVGPEVAALLALTQVTAAIRLDVDAGGGFVAVRELDTGTETVSGRLPALVSVVEALMKPRRIPPAVFRETSPEAVEVWTASMLGLAAGDVGLLGSPTVVLSVRADAPVRRREVLGGPDAAGRLVDLLHSEGAFGTSAEALPPAQPVRRHSGPCIVVVAESEDGDLHRAVAELLGEASRAASALGGFVVAVAVGGEGDAAKLGARGADSILTIGGDRGYSCERWTAAVLAAVDRLRPHAVLAPATARGRDVLPRVAAALQAGMVGDAIALELDVDGRLLALKPAFGGSVVAPIASRTSPLLATIRPGTCVPLAADPSRAVPVATLALPAVAARLDVLFRERDEMATALTGARGTVVCAGYGVGGPEGVEQVRRFARDIGAALGGSRRVVDAGWLPRSRQVGVSGQALVSRLYIGVAVRGAANHLVGLRRVGTVVAINNDPRCGLFEATDYALLCDWRDGTAALCEAMRERGLV